MTSKKFVLLFEEKKLKNFYTGWDKSQYPQTLKSAFKNFGNTDFYPSLYSQMAKYCKPFSIASAIFSEFTSALNELKEKD